MPGHLAETMKPAHLSVMNPKQAWYRVAHNEVLRVGGLVLAGLLLVLAPIIGLLPGPGGIFVFAAGLALALKNSAWLRRRYVRLKRMQPKLGHWADWGMRRRSTLRRIKRDRRRRERDAGRSKS